MDEGLVISILDKSWFIFSKEIKKCRYKKKYINYFISKYKLFLFKYKKYIKKMHGYAMRQGYSAIQLSCAFIKQLS